MDNPHLFLWKQNISVLEWMFSSGPKAQETAWCGGKSKGWGLAVTLSRWSVMLGAHQLADSTQKRADQVIWGVEFSFHKLSVLMKPILPCEQDFCPVQNFPRNSEITCCLITAPNCTQFRCRHFRFWEMDSKEGIRTCSRSLKFPAFFRFLLNLVLANPSACYQLWLCM